MSTDQPKKSKPTVKRGSLVKRPLPERSRDVPATQGMLEGVRSELKSEIRSVRSEMNSRFIEVHSKIDATSASLNARMDALDASLNARMDALDASLNARMDALSAKIDAQFETMNATLFRMAVLSEEQRAENRIVLEALTGMMQRQDRLEGRVDVLERFRAPGQ